MSDREAFEHWYADYTGDAHIRKYCDSTGRYQFKAMESAWQAWQAALQGSEPVALEWNGEGLPPFGVDCKITTRTILGTDEYEGIGMFIAQTMDYYVMLMQIDRTPWVRSKDRVTFRPIKSERDQQIDALLSIFQTLPYFVFSRDMAADLYDEGVRVEK